MENIKSMENMGINCNIQYEQSKKTLKNKYHIVFCLDSSGSMSGSRWNNLVECFNNFVQNRKDSKCWDIISIILYNENAHKVCIGKKIKRSKFFSTLGIQKWRNKFCKCIDCCR